MNFDHLPVDVAHARLPTVYEAAKIALAECWRIDECKDWADKAEALASYARQANDDELHKMATRIQSRAVSRCGEILETYDGRGNNQHSEGALSKQQVAREAGLSEHQQVTATRVANVPREDFERQVESANPPTVTALAEQGRNARPKPEPRPGYPEATRALGLLRDFAKFCGEADSALAASAVEPWEREQTFTQIEEVVSWLRQFQLSLGERADAEKNTAEGHAVRH